MNQITDRVTRLECTIEQLQTSNRRLKQGVLGLGALLALSVVLGAAGFAPDGTGVTPDKPLYVLPVDQNGDFCTSNGAVHITAAITDSREGNQPENEE